jgi:hypothetical protein
LLNSEVIEQHRHRLLLVAMERISMKSKKVAKRTIKDLESQRDHLAHAQDIVQPDWPQIVRLSMRLEITVRR